MVRVQVAKGFRGPTVIELYQSGLLDGRPHAVEAAWGNTHAEIQVVRKHGHISFILSVPDVISLHRAALTLGISAPLPEDMVAQGKKSLTSMEQSDWRAFSAEVGTPVAKTILVHHAAQAVRRGENPRRLRRILDQCLLRNVSAVEADVLLGLGLS